MRKFLNYGLIAILGVMTVLAPSCTKDLKDDIKEIRNELTTLATTTMLDSKIEAVTKQLATLSSSIQKEIDATKAKITDLEGQIPTLATKADLATLTARVTALETWKGTVITELTNIKSELTRIEAAYKTDDEAIKASLALVETKLTEDILRIDGQIEGMLGDIASMKDSILKNAEAITENAEKIGKNAEAIVTNYNEYLAKVADIKSKIGALEAKDALLQEAINNAASAANDEYAKIRTEIATEKQSLQTLIEGIQTQLTDVTTRLTDAEESLENIGAEISTAVAAETAARETAISELNAQLVAINTKLTGIDESILAINEKLVTINNDIANLNGRIQAINFISDFADGKATVYSIDGIQYSDMTLRFRIYPADQAKNIVTLFTTAPEKLVFNMNEVATRAAEAASLTITNVENDANRPGDIIVTARPSDFNITPATTYSMSLDIVSGIDNTSSNVFAIHNANFAKGELQYTKSTTEKGTAVDNTFDIDYSDLSTTVEINTNAKLGAFSSSKLSAFFETYGFKGYTTKITKVTVGSTEYSITDASSITTAQTAADTDGFTLNIEKMTAKVKAENFEKIDNTLTLTIGTFNGETEIASSTIIVKIIPTTIKHTYSAVSALWDNTLSAKDIKFDLSVLATKTGLTIAQLAGQLNSGNFTKTGDDDANFTLSAVGSSDTEFKLTAATSAKWDNKDYTGITLTKTLTDKRKLEITIEKITLKLPEVTLSKANGFWTLDGTKMNVQGEYTKNPGGKITGFKMTGDLRRGFGIKPTVLPAGIKLVFDVVSPVSPAVAKGTWALAADKYTLDITSYDPANDANLLKVNAKIEFTDGNGTYSIPATEFQNVSIQPVNPVKSAITVDNAASLTYTQQNTNAIFNLNNVIRVKETLFDKELRQSAVSVSDQSSYYITALGGDFDAAFLSYEQFGLTDSVDKLTGAEFTLGSITYTDGSEIDAATKEKIETTLNLTDGKIQYDYKGITLNKDVTVKVNVILPNFWGASKGTIDVKISKTI